jgi:hypothetical protein
MTDESKEEIQQDLLPSLYATLDHIVGFEAVSENVADNQIRVLHRVSKDGMQNWLVMMQHLLQAAERAPWNVDLSKQYFLRANRVHYGWRMIIQAQNVRSHLPAIIAVVQAAPRARRVVEEMPLVGAGTSRSAMGPGRGAQTTSASKHGL